MKAREMAGGLQDLEVLAGMVYSPAVLGPLSAVWQDPGLFADDVFNRLAGWAVGHYRRHGDAPGAGLQSHLLEWAARDNPEGEILQTTESVLLKAQEMHERNGSDNPQRLLDVAGKRFNLVRFGRLQREIQSHVEANRPELVEEALLRNGRKLEVGADSYECPFSDLESLRSTFAHEHHEAVVSYPGALGEFWGDQLERDSLVAVMGAEKYGKSWLLLDLAYMAWRQRRRVAYFQVGDLSLKQIKERLAVRRALHPSRSTNADYSWPCAVRYPVKMGQAPAPDPAPIKFEEREYDRALYEVPGWDEQFLRGCWREVGSKEERLRLHVAATRTMSALDVKTKLDTWARLGWHADVVIIDYADVLAPVHRKEDPIQQIKTTWEYLSQIRGQFHCLLATATQVNSKSYGKHTLDRSNFSGNHLKFAEVTTMVSIGMTPAEKESQQLRLNILARRQGHYSSERCIRLATCLPLSSPCVLSSWCPPPARP